MHHHVLTTNNLRQNDNTGVLQFVVLGKVVDMKTLQSILGGIITIATTIIPILTALIVPTSTDDDAGPCSLSPMETTRVRAAMLGHNSSCDYNQTLASILEW